MPGDAPALQQTPLPGRPPSTSPLKRLPRHGSACGMTKFAKACLLVTVAVSLAIGATAAAVALIQRKRVDQLEAAVCVLRARQALSVGDRVEARALLEQAIRRDRTVEGARGELVRLEFANREFRRAIMLAGEEVALRPKSAAAHTLLGTAFLLSQMPEAAEKELRRALDLDPGQTDAVHNLSQFYRERNQAHLALGILDAYLALRPADHVRRFRRAMILLELGQAETVGQEVRRKLESSSATATDLVAGAGAALALKKPDEARRFLGEAARSLAPADLQAMLQDPKMRALMSPPAPAPAATGN